MRAFTESRRPELRGSTIGLAMLAAAAIVFGGIVAVVFVQEVWVVAAAVVLEIAVILGGVAWILPILADREETEDAGIIGSDMREDDNVIALDARRRETSEESRRPSDHTPRVAA